MTQQVTGKFKSTEELGFRDPRISETGRPKLTRKRTRREIRENELMSILRKIKPHLSDSIMTAAKIMKNDVATDGNKLKAAVILLNAYREIVGDVYNGEDRDDEEGNEVQESAPVFSLKVVD